GPEPVEPDVAEMALGDLHRHNALARQPRGRCVELARAAIVAAAGADDLGPDQPVNIGHVFLTSLFDAAYPDDIRSGRLRRRTARFTRSPMSADRLAYGSCGTAEHLGVGAVMDEAGVGGELHPVKLAHGRAFLLLGCWGP